MTATSKEASLALLLRAAYPKHTAKHVARVANTPVSTAKAWIAGRFTPSAAVLLRMASACERMATVLENFARARSNAAATGEGAARHGVAPEPARNPRTVKPPRA